MMRQRRLKNLLLNPTLQIRLGMYTILLSVGFAAVFSSVVILSFRRLFEFIIDMTDARDQVIVAISEQVNIMSGWLIVVALVYVIAVILIAIVFTHRLIGPTIAFRRHIRNLINGNFGSRVHLRKHDTFIELADDLNELAMQLEKKSNT